jgi:hypothetical protein
MRDRHDDRPDNPALAAICDAIDDDTHHESWLRVDLWPYLTGDVETTVPTVLRRDDGAALFYPGCVNGVHGDSGSGKSLMVACATAQELRDGRTVAWIDLEDPSPVTLIERLRMFNVDDHAIGDRLHYFAPHDPFTAAAVEHVVDDIRAGAVTLFVLDSLGEAFSLEGVDENLDVEVAPFLRDVARKIADAGPAVVLVDHSTKAADSPLHPSGSKRKRAAITGASYLLTATVTFTRERGGRAQLICAKDRHGRFRRGDCVAILELQTWPDAGVTAHVLPPPTHDEGADTGRVRLVARKAVQAAKEHDEPVSQRTLIQLMDQVKASTDMKRAALELAVSRGALKVIDGPRRSLLHMYVHDLADIPLTAPDDE